MRIMLHAGAINYNKGNSRSSQKRAQINHCRKHLHLRSEDTGSPGIHGLVLFLSLQMQCLLDCVNYESNISYLSFSLAIKLAILSAFGS